MEDEYQPLYRLRRLLQREIWYRLDNNHMFDRDDANTETVVEALIDVQRAMFTSWLWRCADAGESTG